MTISVGIGLAFIAMLCWGFGDFLIQKSTRKLGDWETLFFITGFGTIILIPFVWRSIPDLFVRPNVPLGVLISASVILFIAALLDLEALRKGKLAIVEPIWSFEIVSAALLSFFVLGQVISMAQVALIVILIAGLVLVAFRGHISKNILLEKGVLIACVAAIAMGCANFFLGWGSQISNPLVANFFVNAFMTLGCGIYLISHGKIKKTFSDLKRNVPLLFSTAISDNVAWVAYAFSMTLAPIAVATALSESYIIITVILGLTINHEKLMKHQKVGLIGAIISAIVLAVITSA